MPRKHLPAYARIGVIVTASCLLVTTGSGIASASVDYENYAGAGGNYETSHYGYLALNSKGANGDKLVEYVWQDGDQTEQWEYLNGSGSSGSVHNLKSVYSGRCLDETKKDTGSVHGTVEIWDCNTSTAQRWVDWNQGTSGGHNFYWIQNASTYDDLWARTDASGASSNNVVIDSENIPDEKADAQGDWF
ncbi:hypothetical protein GCM10029978_032560 [Actinoallomurus acanthiterrae]